MLVTRLRIPTILIILSSIFLVHLGNAQNTEVLTTNLDTMCELKSENPFAPDQEYSGKIIKAHEIVDAVYDSGRIGIRGKEINFSFNRITLDCGYLPRNLLAKLRPNDGITVIGAYESITEQFGCVVQLSRCEIIIHSLNGNVVDPSEMVDKTEKSKN